MRERGDMVKGAVTMPLVFATMRALRATFILV